MPKKKQYLLAAIGLVIMVALLVGSSYAALFNYENVNVGDLKVEEGNKFDVEGETEVTVSNLMPISYGELDENENIVTMTTIIAAHNSMETGQNYAMYLVSGENENPIDDSVIYARITYPTVNPGYAINYFGLNEEQSFGKDGKGAPLTGLNYGKEIKLIGGNIHTLAKDAKQTFIITFWLDSSKVVVSDTIARDINNLDENGKLVYRTEEIKNLSTNIKLKVVNE